jgi:hypothetical protein
MVGAHQYYRWAAGRILSSGEAGAPIVHDLHTLLIRCINCSTTCYGNVLIENNKLLPSDLEPD